VQPLPVDEVIPAITAALARRPGVVVTAPPGSGKSTRVPPALAAALPGKVLLLQPRRIAARALARRIAQERGWTLGQEVGFQVRHERVGGPATRLWVMTEGTLTRRLGDDPYLEGVSAVVLDEFHERSLHSDLAIAYLREVQRTVRDDLRLVVMSATIDPAPVAAFLDAEVVDAPGRVFAVTVRHRPVELRARLEESVAPAVAEAAADAEAGDILVFLPGAGEIRACQRALAGLPALAGRDILPLHGSLPGDEQDRAIAPSTTPKVVLATNVAETSVTIPGVRTVIDTGVARVNRFDPASGLDRLVLEPIPRFSADQRAGRAGRTAPGRCWRLWSPASDASRPQAADPEVRRVDLAGTVLALKAWGYADARRFPWFEPPEEHRLAAAAELLAMLGASDGPWGALTERGGRMAALPAHPRLARLLLDAQQAGRARLGAALAALIGERDLRPPLPRGAPPPAPRPAAADACDRLEALARAERRRFDPGLRGDGIDPAAAREAAKVRDELERALRAEHAGRESGDAEDAADDSLVCRLLLAAYPERVVRRAAKDANRGQMVGGVPVELDDASAVAARPGYPRGELFLAVAVQGLGQGLKTVNQVRQAAEIDEADLEAVFPGSVRREERLRWDEAAGKVEGSVAWTYRGLAIRIAREAQGDPAAVAALLAEKLAPEAEALVLADETAGSLLRRWRWLAAVAPALVPAPPDAAALARLVANLCEGCRSRAAVAAKPMADWLRAEAGFAAAQRIDELAPATLPVPTGNRIRLDYTEADAQRPPVLAVRLQELFGLPATPTIVDGRIGVLLHLLGPNYRCEQVTRDLASFWANTYPQVRKDLRGRYPKHSWPDDPLSATPEAKGRRRS
jgi:ATP-dependent helicase HrpB